MATAAFKSTSKRGTTKNPNPTPNSSSSKPLRRRSLSVSAIGRSTSSQDQDAASFEFSNKRDNPLFWTSNSPPDDGVDGFAAAKVASGSTKSRRAPASAVESRGRSTTRSSEVVKNGIGRSVSRARGRSVSRGHYGSAYESEREQEPFLSKSSMQRGGFKQVANSFKGSTLVEKNTNRHRRVCGSQIATVRGQGTECSEDDSAHSLPISTWEDGISIGSLSEAEDKGTKASEQSFRDGHWGNDSAASGMYNTGRTEVRCAIDDIQSDLQSSEERTRQLQADLALEEHHRQELNRILKEIEPDPKKISPQGSQIGRRRSNERKKISRRLTEDAMAYFDECVSISTFDGSDFSAPEDPPRSSNEATFPVNGSLSEPQGTMDGFPGSKMILGDIGQMDGDEGSSFRGKVSNGSGPRLQFQFSFTQKSPSSAETDDEIRSCIKHFEKEGYEDGTNAISQYDASEYKSKGQIESICFDRMLYSKRVHSGGLHLCVAGIAVAGFPFASSI